MLVHPPGGDTRCTAASPRSRTSSGLRPVVWRHTGHDTPDSDGASFAELLAIKLRGNFIYLAVFWVVSPWSLLVSRQRLRRTWFPYLQGESRMNPEYHHRNSCVSWFYRSRRTDWFASNFARYSLKPGRDFGRSKLRRTFLLDSLAYLVYQIQ